MTAAECHGLPPTATTLRRLRDNAELTQRQLADRAGLAPSTVARVERGATPHIATARALARALDLPLLVLLPDTDAPATGAGKDHRP